MHAHEHAGQARTYVVVLATLLTLTVATVLAAGVNFGSPSINVVVALAIASIKGSLVALYFMHLRHDKPMSAIIFTAGLVFLAIFLMFCVVDSGARRDEAIRPARIAAVRP